MAAQKRRTLLSWSSGKDAAWALFQLRQRDDVEVVGLLCSLNREAGRVSMHAVRETLLEAQAASVGLPLHKVQLPFPCSNEDYEAAMLAALERARQDQIEAIAFGDLFLEDVRAYREQRLSGTGFEPLFPLWGQDTTALARRMLAAGLGAVITCVDPKQLDPSFVGRSYDAELLDALPAGVDPCGERGEFHSFAHAGPMFSAPIEVEIGEVVERDGFCFADLMRAPAPGDRPPRP